MIQRRLAARGARRRTGAARPWSYRLGSLALFAFILLVWELLPRWGVVSTIILPPFTDVLSAIGRLLTFQQFMLHFRVTMMEILVGFIIAVVIGFLIGVALQQWKTVNRVLYPFVVAFQAVPKIVFAPLFIAWFGFGETSKIVMAVVIGFFPVLINTMVGLESVPTDALKLMRSLGASRFTTFWKVSLPSALPLISAGVKAALTFAVTGALVGEFVGSSRGLGFLLQAYNFQLRIDSVFAVITLLAVIGALLYFIIDWLDRKLIFWRDDSYQ